jgi:UDPglucose--hexose-1-phosphate uridylyltransferase
LNQLRWDPTLQEWVSYATHRQDRTFLPPAEYCPLCPTKPGGFPTEVPRESYDIVVFENKFPSFVPTPQKPRSPAPRCRPPPRGRGAAEVVVYSDDHDATLAELSEGRTRNLIGVWTDRYRELGAREEIAYVFIFENKGEAIGVTLHHPHGQIYGYPFVPPRPRKELEAARAHRERSGTCLHCDLLAEEQADGRRILHESEYFTVFVPFHAHFPYEAHVYARRCVPSLAYLDENERRGLAHALKRLLTAYDSLWGFSLPYMMAMHQAPTDGNGYEESLTSTSSSIPRTVPRRSSSTSPAARPGPALS